MKGSRVRRQLESRKGGDTMAAKKPPRTTAGSKEEAAPVAEGPYLYTLEVVLISGLISDKFADKNPVVSRTIQIRGDQTLEDLHFAIFDAFGRDDEHLYEFQLGGRRPQDRNATIYRIPMDYVDDWEEPKVAGYSDETTLDSLALRTRRRFFYWFDFGDDWWHQINVLAVDNQVPRGKFPPVIEA